LKRRSFKHKVSRAGDVEILWEQSAKLVLKSSRNARRRFSNWSSMRYYPILKLPVTYA